MATRDRPGQIRVHRGFLKAERKEAMWPEGVRVREVKERTTPTPSSSEEGRRGLENRR